MRFSKLKALHFGALLAFACLGAALVLAPAAYSKDSPVSDADADAAAIVESISRALRGNYPLPKISEIYAAALAKNLQAGRYRRLSDCDLAARLTEDLRNAHRDLHLRVICDAGIADSGELPNAPGAGGQTDFGVERVELFPNMPVAYIRSAGGWREDAFNLIANAMGMAAHARYVIIDVRDNPGGKEEVGNFLASYFFPAGESTILANTMFLEHAKDIKEGTYPFVPGKRLPDAKLYILVNANTASAAEGFAFGLQSIKRATIIGQTTAGAGIGGFYQKLKDGLAIFLPDEMIVAPNTTEGFEGRGVTPDIVTDPGKEEDAALGLIAKDLRLNGESDVPERLPAADETSPLKVEPVATGPMAPPLEACQKKEIDLERRQITVTNICDGDIVVQFVSSLRPNLVYQNRLKPREAFRAGFYDGVKENYWWVSATCAPGYYTNVPLTGDNAKTLAAGDYQCARQ